MTDEPKRRGRPPKAISGSDEQQSGEWQHPPLQGHTEEQEIAAAPENPTIVQFVEPTTILSQDSEKFSLDLPQDALNAEDSLKSHILPHGFQSIETAPKDARIVVSETGEDQTVVFWRIRRVVDKKNLRYVKQGAWTDDFRRIDIDFEPKYWRPYEDTDYVLMMRAK